MTPKRLYFLLIGAFSVVVGLGIGLTVYAADMLKARSNDIVTLKLDTLALEEQKKIALQAENDLRRYADTKEGVEKIIPKNKDQARAVAELIQIASDVGATINSISFPASDLGAATPKPTTTTEEGQQSTTDTPSTPKTSTISQAKPVEGLAGILGVDVIVTQIDRLGATPGTGMTYSQMLDFLRAVERNRRTMQVKSIQIQPIRNPEPEETTYTLTLNLTIFVKP